MKKVDIVQHWIKRYTGTAAEEFGEWILLTNFQNYVEKFAKRFNVPIKGVGGPMTSATNKENLSIINFGMGSSNAATIMDLLSGVQPKGVLFLGKCGGLKNRLNWVTSSCRSPPSEGREPAMIISRKKCLPCLHLSYINMFRICWSTMVWNTGQGSVYTTNRRVWEYDESFKQYLRQIRAIGIDMETATLFIVGFANGIDRGALLLVSDTPMTPEGVKTEESDKNVTRKYVDLHLSLGIEAMTGIGEEGEPIKHFTY